MPALSVRDPRLLPRALFGGGHFAKSLIWSFSDLLTVYYLHERLGISGMSLTLILAPALILAGFMDLGLGWMLRALRLRQILILQAVAGGATGVAAIVFFLLGGLALGALVLAMVAFRIAYAAYDVAQNALTSLLPLDDADADRYVTLRAVLSSAARLCVATLGLALVGDAAPLAGWEAIVMLPIVALALASGLALLSLGRTSTPRPPDAATPPVMPPGMAPILLAAFAHAAALSAPARLIPFAPAGQMLLLAFVAGTLAGPLVADRLAPAAGKGATIVILATLAVGGVAGLVMASPSWAVVLIVLHGVGIGGTGVALWSATSRIVRGRAACVGVHDDLWGFALLTGVIKFGIAANMLVLPWLMQIQATGVAVAAGIAVVGAAVFIAAMRSEGSPPNARAAAA